MMAAASLDPGSPPPAAIPWTIIGGIAALEIMTLPRNAAARVVLHVSQRRLLVRIEMAVGPGPALVAGDAALLLHQAGHLASGQRVVAVAALDAVDLARLSSIDLVSRVAIAIALGVGSAGTGDNDGGGEKGASAV